jgi:hypothetical protein
MRRETFPTPEPPKLRIALAAGDVELETDDVVETSVEIEGPLEDDAKIEMRRDEIVIEVGKKRFLGAGGSHHVRVTAPHGARVDANVASADVEGRGRFGQVEVNSASGDVRFDDVDGSAAINSASGDVELGAVSGKATVRSASGDVRLREAAAGGSVNTASGDIQIDSVTEGEVSVKSASGDVSVGVRRGSKVHVEASSMSGDTTSELALSDAPIETEGPLVEIRARTMSGDITIRRA